VCSHRCSNRRSSCYLLLWHFTAEFYPQGDVGKRTDAQIAAAVHVAAALDNSPLCEFNPTVLSTANSFLAEPIVRAGPHYHVPAGPGLGIEWNDRFRTMIT
jgi:L-alanine-DL-glutamate epimerase-like enolase superfamily enzyme